MEETVKRSLKDLRQFTVAIVTYNRPEALLALASSFALSGCLNHSPLPVEILILDNASPQKPEEALEVFRKIVEGTHHSLRYLYSEQNLGCAQGRNILAGEATGDVIVFIDDDAKIADPFFFKHLYDLFCYHADSGAVVFPVYEQPTNRVWVPHKRKEYMTKSEFYTYIFWGSAHAISKKLFMEVAGYSPAVSDRGEEYDLAFKIISRGYKIFFSTRTFLIHCPATTGRHPPLHTVINQAANRIFIAWKYLPWRFVLTHCIAWTLFAMVKGRSLVAGWQALRLAVQKCKMDRRTPLQGWARNYLRETRARLIY